MKTPRQIVEAHFSTGESVPQSKVLSRAFFNFLAHFLTTLCFQEHSRVHPGLPAPQGETPMPYYCHQVTYTKDAWAQLMENPQDRLEAVRAPIEKLGGQLQTA